MPYTDIKLASGINGRYQAATRSNPLLVFAHGAGAGYDHAHMTAISDALVAEGIGTLRFNFPFIEAGKRRVDSKDVCLTTINEALELAARLHPEANLLLGGHSFGGRMATHLMAERPIKAIRGVTLFSFPLHPAKKPAVSRAAHLGDLTVPLLFLSGDRDALAEPGLLKDVTEKLPNATLHWLDTADHSFKILKRKRQSDENVYEEAARITASWIKQLAR